MTGQIPVRRGIRDLAALDELIAELRRGGLAGIFPEGRIGAGTGRLRGRSGVTRVARAAGVPVIAVGLWGTQARWPLDGLKILPFRRLPVAVSIGDPIHVRSTHDTTALREDTRRGHDRGASAETREALAALRPGDVIFVPSARRRGLVRLPPSGPGRGPRGCR